MALAHNLGFPHTDRKLEEAVEAFRNGELDEAGLRKIGRELRAEHWQLQQAAGIELLPVGDFAWYDRVLSHSLLFGVVPEHFRDAAGRVTFDTLRAVIDNSHDGQATEVAPWFAGDRPYLVPEFTADQRFRLSWEQLFEEVAEAQALGQRIKPVLIGPLTYLWLGKAKGGDFDRLELLERLLPVYGEVLGRLAGLGVEWVQIDEPILSFDLPQAWKTAFERAYNLLQAPLPQKLLSAGMTGLESNLGLVATLPVAGLHVDLASGPERLAAVFDRLPTYKLLSLGVADARRCDLALLRQAHERAGERLWLAPSDALRHGQSESDQQARLEAGQRCAELVLLARSLEDAVGSVQQAAA